MKRMDTSRKIFTITPAVLLTALMITTIPSAFANSPAYGGISVVVGSDTTLSLNPNSNTLSRGQIIQVVDQDPNVGLPISTSTSSCPMPLTDYVNLLPASDVWELRHQITGTIGYDVGPGAGSYVEIQFGPSAASGTIKAFGSAKVYQVTAGPTFTQIAEGPTAPVVAGTDTYVGTWFNLQGANAPNTNRVDNWFGATCGRDNPPNGVQYQVPGGFQVMLPVAGTILPLDTTALFVAGISASALWLVPLAAVAGGAFAVLRLQVYKKQN